MYSSAPWIDFLGNVLRPNASGASRGRLGFFPKVHCGRSLGHLGTKLAAFFAASFAPALALRRN
jgi:hypothetical protein